MEKLNGTKQGLFENVVEAMLNYKLEGREVELLLIAEVTAEVAKSQKVRLSYAEFALAVNRIFLKARNFDFVKAEKALAAAKVTVVKPLAVKKIQKVKAVRVPKSKAVKAEKK